MDIFSVFKKYLISGISHKSDGNMRLVKDADTSEHNRNAFFGTNKFQDFKLASALLSHSADVVQVAESGFYDGDALITNSRNLLLTVTVADCVPVFIFEPINRVIALAHAGRLGIEKNIVQKTIKTAAEKLDLQPKQAFAFLGPCICESHYPTDLKLGICNQLVSSGIPLSSIGDVGMCTYEEHNDFFSYRRERPQVVQAQVAYMGLV